MKQNFIGERRGSIGSTKDNNNGVLDLKAIYEKVKKKKQENLN